MNNASSLTDEQIKQMLIERGLSKAPDAQPTQPQLTDDQIRQMMQARGLSSQAQHSPLQALLNIGGGIAQGAESAVAGLENLPRDVGLLGRYFGVPGVRQLAKLPAVHAMPAPFAQQQALTTQLPQAATEALGILGTGGAAGIRGAGEVAGAVGRGIGRAARRVGEPIGRRVIEPIAQKLAPITGRTAKETAVDYFKEISQGKPLARLHTPLNNNVKRIFRNAKDATNSNYEYVKNLARRYGFTDYTRKVLENGKIPDVYYEGGSPINPVKSLNPMSKLKPEDPSLKNQISDFLKNPSFNKAHELQAELNRENVRLYHSIRPGDREKAFEFRQARDWLKDDITDSIDREMKGRPKQAEQLKKAYSNAALFHVKEVVPFYDNKLISDMVLAKPGVKQNPEGIFNLLKKESDSTKFIKNRLEPESKDLFIANALQRAFRRRTGTLNVTSIDDFLKKYDELENKGLNEFITDKHDMARDAINQQYKLSKRLRQYGGKAIKIAGTAGLAGAVGKKAWETF